MSFLVNEPYPEINKPNSLSYWKTMDTRELYLKNKDKYDLPYGPIDISYKLNNYGFRCDEFDYWKNYPVRIVFIGCSHTEGIGLPLKEVWAKKLHSIICSKFKIKIPYWNLSVGGIGTDQIVRFLFHYSELLRPNIVISLLPERSRRERWVGEMWNVSELKGYEDRYFIDEEYINYQTEKNFAMINLLMEQLNSMFLYCPADFTPLKLSGEEFPYIVKHNFNAVISDYARDVVHWGPKTHTYIAESMYNGFEPIFKERL